MLNLIITHSPRFAVMTSGKRLGEDVGRNPALMHKLAWLERRSKSEPAAAGQPTESALREQTA